MVHAKALKGRMVAAADSTAKKLLDQIQTMSRESNEHVCHTYASMATGVTTVRVSAQNNCPLLPSPTWCMRVVRITANCTSHCCGKMHDFT